MEVDSGGFTAISLVVVRLLFRPKKQQAYNNKFFVTQRSDCEAMGEALSVSSPLQKRRDSASLSAPTTSNYTYSSLHFAGSDQDRQVGQGLLLPPVRQLTTAHTPARASPSATRFGGYARLHAYTLAHLGKRRFARCGQTPFMGWTRFQICQPCQDSSVALT